MAMPPSSVAAGWSSAAAELADGRAGGAEDHGLGHGSDDSLAAMDRPGHDRQRRPTRGADTVAVGVFEGKGIPHDVDDGALGALVESGEAKRGVRPLAVAHAAGRRWILVGLGDRDDFDGEQARVAAAVALGRAQRAADADAVLGAAAQGARRRRRRARRGHAAARLPLRRASSRDPGEDHGAARADRLRPPRRRGGGRARRASSARGRRTRARDLSNAPPNAMTPAALAERARELRPASRPDVEVMGREEIEAAGMGAFAAVAAGGRRRAALITICATSRPARPARCSGSSARP